jgi:hypothetical protein
MHADSALAAARTGDETAFKRLVERSGDVQRVVSMLTEDVAWSMPLLASWYGGIEEVEVFLRTKPLTFRSRSTCSPSRVTGSAK